MRQESNVRQESKTMRTLLLILLLALWIASSATAAPPPPLNAAASPILLENEQVAVEIEPVFGRFSRILDKQSRMELASLPDQAGNFRLDLGLPEKKTVTILGRDQKLTGATRGLGSITLNWNGPLKDAAGGEHAVAVRMEVQTSGNAVEFRLHLDNHTEGKIRSVSYPLIGGLAKFGSPGKSSDGMLWAPVRGFSSKKVEPPFGNATFRYPGQASMSFTCIESKAAG